MPKIKPENRLIDKHELVGKTFSKWIILEYLGNGRYNARCQCGHEKVKKSSEIMYMRSTQCIHCRRKQLRNITRNQIAIANPHLDIDNE